MGRHQEKLDPSTVDGITAAQAKKVLRYVFGTWFYSLRQKGCEFHIILLEEVKDKNGESLLIDRELIDDFLSYWGKSFYKLNVMRKEDIYDL